MDLNEALYGYLSTYSGLAALIGSRLYPDIIPELTPYPSVSFQLISRVRPHLFQQDSSLIQSRVQFSIYARKRSDTKAVAKQIRLALQNYSGLMSTVSISAVQLDGEDDLYESKTLIYGTVLDFLVWHEE